VSDKLDVGINIVGDQTTVQLTGVIDEDADFSKIKNLESTKIVFDFQKVSMINSCGIREWIQYLVGLGTNSQIIYVNCPQIIIEQINMVQGFIPKGAKVESFYAPYFCEDCDKEVKMKINSADIQSFKAPKCKCGDCGAEMEFDAIEAQYFNFLKQG